MTHEIISYWKENQIWNKVKQKNAEGEDYYFLDGPPYTSGYVHIGTAWNKALKDCIIRYKRARGYNVWDRAGYDMHGLPVEHKVQAKLKLEQKEDILEFGLGKFIEECKDLAIKNLEKMNKDFEKLGVWMDFENAYRSVDNTYVEGVWWLIKRAHEKKRLYEDYKPIHWDYLHQSALAKHELEYQTVKDKSIFLKLHVKENEYLIVWTTTPWTIAYNLGVMANPDLDYVKAKVDDEVWVLAKGLVAPVVQSVVDKKYEILEEFKGSKLEGLNYTHPLHDELGKQYDELKSKHPNVHTVVLSTEHVTLDAGSGLVHMAPGCGPEDYDVGRKNDIPAWNNLLENGKYPDDMGKFSGWHAKNDGEKFIEDFDSRGCLIAQTEIEHEYPFGQRSHKPVVFRAAKQWFFKVEDLKEKLIKENNEINWIPKAAYNAFNAWLTNLRDNSISKQRYWGTPLPIWRNIEDESDYLVIGSKKELEEMTKKSFDNLHLPFIDEAVITKDGKTYKRIPDVLDVWVDAGTASWNCLDYPRTDKHMNLFPADFILEGKDQIRGWFNLLSIASMLGFDTKSFKNVYMHGFVQDAAGRKMSKSLGNSILPEEVIEKYDADTLRYYMIGGANPGLDINYNFDDMKTKNRNLMVLWNLHNYLIDITKTHTINPTEIQEVEYTEDEKLMISRLHSSIKKITETFDAYKLSDVPEMVEELFLELSRGYLQKVRDKLSQGDITAIKVFYDTLFEIIKLFTPIAPFMTEKIYLNLKKEYGLKEESISLLPWPTYDETKINANLEKMAKISEELIASALYAREKVKIGLRWPVSEVIISTDSEDVKKSIEHNKGSLELALNAKYVVAKKLDLKEKVKPLFKKINQEYGGLAPRILAKLSTMVPAKGMEIVIDDTKITLGEEFFESEIITPADYSLAETRYGPVLVNTKQDESLLSEGFTREIMRRVQIVRKDEGLDKRDDINLFIGCSEKVRNYLEEHRDKLLEKVGAVSAEIKTELDGKEFKIKDEKVNISIEKI